MRLNLLVLAQEQHQMLYLLVVIVLDQQQKNGLVQVQMLVLEEGGAGEIPWPNRYID